MAASTRTLQVVGIILIITSIFLFSTGVHLKAYEERSCWGSPYLYTSLFTFLLGGASFVAASERNKTLNRDRLNLV